MALSFNLETEKDILFEDFIDHAKKTIDPRQPMTLLECREELQMLTNNRSFVTDFINNELSDLDAFQKGNAHTVQSLMMYQNPKFYVRLNAWPTLSSNPNVNIWQKELYQTLKAHDHNFWFLTTGYMGGGYTTEIWEYDYGSVIGYKGEDVDIRFLERTTLPRGKSMLYRASTDIHTQIAPTDYSLSLNVMLISNEPLEREQFYFDLETKKIAGNTNTALTTRYMMFDLAAIAGDERSRKLVDKIAHTHELPHIRLKGFQTLSSLSDNKSAIWKDALSDPNKIVSEAAKNNLNLL